MAPMNLGMNIAGRDILNGDWCSLKRGRKEEGVWDLIDDGRSKICCLESGASSCPISTRRLIQPALNIQSSEMLQFVYDWVSSPTCP